MDWLECIKRAQAGDRRAFEIIVEQLRAPAVLFAFQYVRDFHLAEEMVQEAFVRLYCHLERYSSQKASLQTYFFAIVRYRCLDELRKRRFSMLPWKEVAVSSLQNNPERCYLKKEQQMALVQSLNSLPEKQKTAVYLRDVEGLSYQEIALVMQSSVNRVKTYIHRGRKKLAVLLRKEAD